MPAVVNINTYSDADFVAAFVYQKNGVAVDLTGSSLAMMVRPGLDPSIADVVVSLDNASIGGIVVTDAPNGKFTITIPQASLAKMPSGPYVHALVRSYGTGPTLHERVWGGQINHTIGIVR
jgi:hypothetical protein